MQLAKLGVEPVDIVQTHKNDPASINRYIYYPDHLVRLPTSTRGVTDIFHRLHALLTEPLFKGMAKGLYDEVFGDVREEDLQDESVGSFLNRRFGKDITDNLASAFFHGIYAGDLYKLSARTLLPRPWKLEAAGTSIFLELTAQKFGGKHMYPQSTASFAASLVGMKAVEKADLLTVAVLDGQLRDASVYTLQRGLGDLVRRLEEALSRNPNVTIIRESRVTAVNFSQKQEKLSVDVANSNQSRRFDYLVSTLSPSSMASFLEQSAHSRGVSHSSAASDACKHSHRSVSVMVVNLYYSDANLIPSSLRGFGYLIPRSVPFDENPERALGVIFSSETSGGRGADSRHTTKVYRAELDETLKRLAQDHEEMSEGYNSLKDAKEKNPQITAPGMDEVLEAGRLAIEDYEKDIKKTKAIRAKLFGSDVSKESVDVEITLGQDSAPGTKLTIMMGGHWWEGWTKEDLPNEEEAITMAKNLLARHLKITDEPEVAKARLAENCIPQYPVGYREDMASIHSALLDEYRGRFKVAGPWWQGAVGVNDCILKGRETAWAIREQWDHKTGLERYLWEEGWCYFHEETGETLTVGGEPKA